MPRLRWPTILLAAAVALTNLNVAAPEATSAPLTATAAPTACESSLGARSGFLPVLQLDLPEHANWLDQTPPYAVDNTGQLTAGFDRVGYCLEVDGPAGPQWVWTAMESFTDDRHRLGLPTRVGELVRQRVDDLEVASSVAGVGTGSGLSGYLEMWPNTYRAGGGGQIADASSSAYDADDTPTTNLTGYGSFQVHQVARSWTSAEPSQTILAINGFTESGPMSIGIGTRPDATNDPDWTFARNAGQLSKRRLTVYARPSVLTLTAAPQGRQLFPRDTAGGATVRVAGRVTDGGVRNVQLRVISGPDSWTYAQPAGRGSSFEFTPRIVAGLREYRLELRAFGNDAPRTVGIWDGVVAGDVYVVQGQSNAVAAAYHGSAAAEQSPYLRSFGSASAEPSLSTTDRRWHYATGDITHQPGSVGQWAIRMGRRLVDTYGVPVAVLNGGHGGQPISFFQRDDAAPDDPTTNYGRLRQRLAAAGVIGKVQGVLWYQGESENDNAAAHVAGFTALLEDWKADLGGPTRYYVVQVRTSPCNTSTTTALRDAQRRLGDTHGVTVLSTTGLSGHDGCHYAWENGYRDLGDHAFTILARDLYGGPAAGVAPPNPRSARFSNAASTEITVQLRSNDPLTVDPGAGNDFRVDGTTVSVVGVAYRPGGQLVLTLSAPAAGATGLSYLSHLGAGPRIATASGAGLLAFALSIE